MTKARTLANFISDNNEFADGTISVAEVSGAAPLESPSFTGTLYMPQWIEHSGDSNTYFGFPGGDEFKIVAAAVGRLHMTGSQTVFTEGGEDRDFRVESTSNSHMLFVDAGNNRLKVGSSDTTGSAIVTVFDDKDNSASDWYNDRAGLELYNYSNPAGYGTSIGILQEAHSGEQTYWYTKAPSNTVVRGYIGARTSGAGDVDVIEWDQGSVVINDASNDVNFRVESNNNSEMFFIDGGGDWIGIGGADQLGSNTTVTINSATVGAYDQSAQNTSGGMSLWKNNNNGTAGESIGIRFRVTNNSGSNNADGAITYVQSGTSSHEGFMAFQTRNTNGGRYEQLRIASNDGVVFNEGGHGFNDFRVESDGNAHAIFLDASTDVVDISTNAVAHDTATKLQVAGRVRFGSGFGAETAGMTTPTNSMILTKESFSPTSGATRIYGLSAQNSGYAVSGSTAPMAVLLGGWNNGSSRAGGIEYDPSTYNLHIMAGATGAGQTGFQDTGRVASFNSSSIVFNDQGNNQDFRVESDGNQYALFVDADQDTTHIGGQGGNYVANVYSNTVNSPSGAMLINAALNNSGEGLFIDAATRSINEETQRIFRTRDRQSYNIQTTLVGGDTIFNDDGASWQDFTVESDGNANMLKVDGASNTVLVGKSSSTHSNVSNISFEAVDMAVIGNGWISGYVAGTSNNNSGFILIHDFTSLSAGSYGGAWHGKVIINSYTGSAYVDFSYIKRYNSADQNTIAFSVRDSTGGMSGVSTVNLQLVVCTYDGRKYIGIKKNGGGTGTTYLQGMGQFGNNSAKLLEVTSVTSVDRTIGTLI